nr:S8 family peptidase [Haladaptatus caseinilyticus]
MLKLAGGSLAVAGASGFAAAKPNDKVEVNIGFSSEGGRKAALNAANDVVREFNFDALTLRLPKKAATALEKRSDVRYVEENGTMHALAQTLPWGIDRVDAEVAHANGETGNGADIAIIDTGIDDGHPDLEANLGSGRAFTGGTSSNLWNDDNGHGTHCAGIANAVNNSQGVVGVSTEATLHAVKVLTASGSGSTSDVAKGIEYTADQGWDVGSLSLGGGESSTLKDACEYAASKGVLLVAAAGNDGPCTDCVGYPAAYDECIAVSSTNQSDGLSSFSSQGPEVEIAAPGSDIYSTYLEGTYNTLSGTSMACPHVSGAAAQLIANGQSASQARSQLKSTAEDIGLSSNESGSGLLDVAAALGLDSSDST